MERQKLTETSRRLQESYLAWGRISKLDGVARPRRSEIYSLVDKLFEIVYPGFWGREAVTKGDIPKLTEDNLAIASDKLTKLVGQAQAFCPKSANSKDHLSVAKIVADFMEKLPDIREMLLSDVISALKGDPAVYETDSIIYCYPTTLAVTTQRLAHELFNMNVPLLPRAMSEYAHSYTGIDIHPGARIGKGFFIDHGTGVVIGETTIIGDNCKLYQGVTLGAASFPHSQDGLIIRGHKRHPTLEDSVIVYSNASVLGNITVGSGATIHGGVFLTQSVPPGCTVSSTPVELKMKNKCLAIGRGFVSEYTI